MDLNSNPMLQSGMRKMGFFLLLWFILEIACFIVVGYFIGGWNVFWIQFGTLILGYMIKPSKNAAAPSMMPGLGGGLTSGRGIASILLMIPGFITDVIGLLVLIPPVRRFFSFLALRKMMPKGMNNMFGQGMNFDPNMLNAFQQMAQNQNAAASGESTKTKKTKKTRKPKETIDIDDYEVQGHKKAEPHAEVVRPAAKQPKALTDEVIDVKYEMEQ